MMDIFITLVSVSLLGGASAWSGGRNFVFAIPEPYLQGSNEYYLHMYISAIETSHVLIEAPAISMKESKTIQSGTTVVPLHDSTIIKTSATIEKKGIHVQSDKPINVYVVNHEQVYSDGFLVLEYSDISREYFVSSYKPSTGSEFAISSSFDNTHVNITLKLQPQNSVAVNHHSYTDKQTFSIRLNRLDAFLIQHSVSDLTGTFITSDKPISVTSGNICAQIPQGQDTCDYLVEQVPPVKTWKTKYIVASFRTKRHFRIRIISSQDANRIAIAGTVRATLDRGEFYEYVIEQDYIAVVEGTYPVLVVQYNERHDIDNDIGDPFMVTIPAVEHYLDEYYFETPTHFISHHGSVIIPTNKVAGLRLDGHALSRSDEKRTSLTNGIHTNSYSVIRFAISSGKHHISHVEPGVTFGMILYGYKHKDSYGLPLGWKMNVTSIVDVRLANNTSSKSGVLELLVDGHWTQACSGSIDMNVAKVVCKTLGYDKYGLPPGAISTVQHRSMTSSTGLRHIICTGQEDSISECKISDRDISQCPSSDIVEVNCAPALNSIIHTTCSPNNWNVTVDMEKLNYRFPGSVSSDIYLGDNTCTGRQSGHQLLLYHDIHGCLTTKTVTDKEIMFTNQLVYAFHDPDYSFIIRSFNWTVDLHCLVPRDQFVHSNVTYTNQNIDTANSVLNTSSHYNISTLFFSDPNFMTTISGNPIRVPVGTNVFVKSFITDVDWTMKMRLHTCYMTIQGGKYYLIKNGCEVDTNTHLLSQTDHETKFVFKVFDTTSTHDVSVKCDAILCDMSDDKSAQQCSQHCT